MIKPGDVLKVEKIKGAKVGSSDFYFDKVLLVADGENVKIGTPFLEEAKVSAKIEEEGRGKKVTILKYKPKTRYRIKKGHRQPYTLVRFSAF